MDYRPLLEEFRDWLQGDIVTYSERWKTSVPKWIEELKDSEAIKKFQSWMQNCFANCHPEYPDHLELTSAIAPRLKEAFAGSEVEIAFWLGRFYEQHRRIQPVPLYSQKELDGMNRKILLEIAYRFPIANLGKTRNRDEDYLKQEILRCQEILGAGESILIWELDIGDRVVIPIKRIANQSDIVVAYVQNIAIGPDPRLMATWNPGQPVHSLFKVAVLPIEEIQGNLRVRINSQIYIPEFYPQERVFRLK